MNTISLLVMAFGISLVIGLFVCMIIAIKYKRKLKSPIYPLEKYASLTLDVSQDVYLGSDTTRVRIARPPQQQNRK